MTFSETFTLWWQLKSMNAVVSLAILVVGVLLFVLAIAGASFGRWVADEVAWWKGRKGKGTR